MVCVKLQQDVLLSKVAHSFQLFGSSHAVVMVLVVVVVDGQQKNSPGQSHRGKKTVFQLKQSSDETLGR